MFTTLPSLNCHISRIEDSYGAPFERSVARYAEVYRRALARSGRVQPASV